MDTQQESNKILRQAAMKMLKLELKFNKQLHSMEYQTQITISKLNNFGELLKNPRPLSRWHPSELPYYISNKSQYNFERGLDILNFSLPETHPLFITFYMEYSNFLEPDLLKRTALILAVKGFGEFHSKTT